MKILISRRVPQSFLLFHLLTFFLINNQIGFSQDSFRRHFIIAFDISNNFKSSLEANPRFQRDLEDLFGNLRVGNPNGNFNYLSSERQSNKQFFDPIKDEISFFQFGIPKNGTESLRISTKQDSTQTLSDFSNAYIRNTNISWSTYLKEKGPSIIGYMFNTFNAPSDLAIISIPNLIYPLILDKIDYKIPAEEYILIVLSTRPPLGFTSNDLSDLNVLYQGALLPIAKTSQSVEYIKNRINKITNYFEKTDYFNFSYKSSNDKINSSIGIFGYFLTPIRLTPATITNAISVSEGIKLSQYGYKNDEFKFSTLKINFPKNIFIRPTSCFLTISTEGNKELPIFNGVVASLDNSGKWTSNYSKKRRLLIFKKSNSFYNLNGLKITLPGINSKESSNNLKLNFEFLTEYNPDGLKPINYIFFTESTIQKENIFFISSTTHNLFYFIIPISISLLIFLFIILYGRPKGFTFSVKGYLDSIIIVDHKKFGKLHTPYTFWNDLEDKIVVDGEVKYYSPKYLFNWNPKIILTIQETSIPEGFSIFLKQDNKSNTIKEFTKGNSMVIKKNQQNDLFFIIGLRQNDINLKLAEPQYIKLKINAKLRKSLIFIKSEFIETIDYNFHIGNDLGDLWIGLDPGTTGSCITTGNQADNIIICEDKFKNKVIDSKLIFEISENYIPSNGEIPESLYKFGTNARTKFGSEGVESFQSIKKLLGYKDVKEIHFNNNNKLNLTGKDLSGLLVKSLYKELYSFIERINQPAYLESGVFNPKRAVIAIPNNFTLSKIQDIIDCTNQLKQFKEIRYIYEAEAVLFYYMSHYSRFNNGRTTFQHENILVFDMGGATINATVVSAAKIFEKQKPIYDIDFLGKIGYGIGGDTIDYCIIKFIKEFSNEYPDFKSLVFSADKKEQLAKTASLIKMQIVNYFEKGYDALITTTQLKDYLKVSLGKVIEISDESSFYQFFKKDSKGNYRLFNHPIFQSLIYNNVKDAVHEVVELSDNCKIDKVIFSGRSTFFPYIKETVETQLKTEKSYAEIIELQIEESKTAVAHGACWYGINKNSIRLNNLKTNASFGIKKTLSSDTRNIEFIELVKMGYPFDSNVEGIDLVRGNVLLNDDFSFDGAKANFYQIMGKNAGKILSDNSKHKFSKIASIRLPQAVTALQITVCENDEVECKVKLSSDKIISEKGVVSDQEINDANEEHYTWIIN
jgi:molecular chaperone DnaK (HSP70)